MTEFLRGNTVTIRARGHHCHPEMIDVGTKRIERLLEGYFDFKPESIDPDDIERKEGQVGRHENFGAALRMDNQNETNQNTDRPPQNDTAPQSGQCTGEYCLAMEQFQKAGSGRSVIRTR